MACWLLLVAIQVTMFVMMAITSMIVSSIREPRPPWLSRTATNTVTRPMIR